MERGVGTEGKLAEVALLHLDQVLLILGAQAVENGGVHDDAQLEVRLVTRALLEYLTQLALNLDAHGQRALDLAPAFAIRAIVIDWRIDALGMPLARHLQQSKL